MTDALLATSPPITGLDPSIVISPSRLHLTLGVMTLSETESGEMLSTDLRVASRQPSTGTARPNEGKSASRHAVSEAVRLLQELKPDIQQMTNSQPLQLTLDELAVMRRSKTGEADVMYLGPASAIAKMEEHAQAVKVLQTVQNRFREAGFVTETRPLKLHCTILNTSHRKSVHRSGPRGVPFSMSEIDAAIAESPDITGQLLSSPLPLAVRKLNICRMGSYDSMGRYVIVGSVEW